MLGPVEIAAAAPDAAERNGLLRQALDLWRGPALADVASTELRQRLCAGLEEERLTALEDRIQADLDAGRSTELIPELTDLIATQDADRARTIGQLGEVLLDAVELGEAVVALEIGLREAIRVGEEADETRLRQRLEDARTAAGTSDSR